MTAIAELSPVAVGGAAYGVPVTSAALPGALHAAGPAPGLAEQLSLFGQFVGSWSLTWYGTGADGRPARATGELHVGWVLGGRAIQDVWIVPGRGEPGEGRGPAGFHGSTLRFYDPTVEAWRSTWIEPVNGRVRRFVGRANGAGIELISDEDDPILRWSFTAVTATGFTWDSESSDDGGTTWRHDERMLAVRVA